MEQYFKDKELEFEKQQKELDEANADIEKQKTDLELKDKETEEQRDKNDALYAQLTKDMEDLKLKKQSEEEVWREETSKLDTKRVALVEERKRVEKLAIELENNKPEGGEKGDEEMKKFM